MPRAERCVTATGSAKAASQPLQPIALPGFPRCLHPGPAAPSPLRRDAARLQLGSTQRHPAPSRPQRRAGPPPLQTPEPDAAPRPGGSVSSPVRLRSPAVRPAPPSLPRTQSRGRSPRRFATPQNRAAAARSPAGAFEEREAAAASGRVRVRRHLVSAPFRRAGGSREGRREERRRRPGVHRAGRGRGRAAPSAPRRDGPAAQCRFGKRERCSTFP